MLLRPLVNMLHVKSISGLLYLQYKLLHHKLCIAYRLTYLVVHLNSPHVNHSLFLHIVYAFSFLTNILGKKD